MQRSTIKSSFLAIVLASALPLAACSDDDTPTSPTQPGPPVAEPAPTPPEPTPPEPTPPEPTPPDVGTAVTVSGLVNRMSRSGPDGIDVLFRVGDEPFVRGDANTVVIDGSIRMNTSALRDGQTVTVEATQNGTDVYATQVTIDSQP